MLLRFHFEVFGSVLLRICFETWIDKGKRNESDGFVRATNAIVKSRRMLLGAKKHVGWRTQKTRQF
jgi:hypothetical protein